ncbi:MAG: hypothetical protein ABF293_13160 [Flavobacteriaceae bacterium]
MNSYFLLMRFEIPNNKIHEFDLAFKRLVKWPVYTLYTTNENTDSKTFEFIRNWESKEEMEKEFDSGDFTNMFGMVKVLGNVLESYIYDVSNRADLMETSALK